MALFLVPALVCGQGTYMWATVTTNTNVWECNPTQGSAGACAVVKTTGLTYYAGGANNNGMAYDPVRHDVLWAYNGNNNAGDTTRGLYYWRQGVDSFGQIASITALGGAPVSAFYYNNYYYYMGYAGDFQADLRRVRIRYSTTTGLPIGIDPPDSYTVTMPRESFDVQDIALRVQDMVVYGNIVDRTVVPNERILFSMSIANLAAVSLQAQNLSTQASSSNTWYQLAFDTTYTTLYGARTDAFVTYNTGTGQTASIADSSTSGTTVNDLGGSSLRSSQGLVGSVIFGINDQNDIVQYDLFAKTAGVALVTGVKSGNQYSNGVAYDRSRNHVFFAYVNPKNQTQNGLYIWERDNPTDTEQRIATLSAIGIDPPANYPFANAVFYQDAYWFILNEQPILRKVPITYTNGGQTASGVGLLTDYPLTGIDFSNLQMGDIVIKPTTNKLYGALNLDTGGLFFFIDLATLSASTPNAMIVTGQNLPTLQLAYTYGYETLYAHDRQTGAWYTVSGMDTTVVLTQVAEYGTYGAVLSARDLGGAAFF